MRATDVFGHKDGYREGYAQFYREMHQKGQTTSFLLHQLGKQPMGEAVQQQGQKLYDELLACFVEDYHVFLEKDKELGIEPKGLALAHLFTELSRIHFIGSYDDLCMQKEDLLANATDDKEIPLTLLTLCPAICSHPFWQDAEQTTPIMQFNQQQVVDFLMWLTTSITYMPTTEAAIQELRLLIQALFTRNSVFLCQTCTKETLNMEEYSVLQCEPNQYSVNKMYIKLCSIYFQQLLRRLYYYDRLTTISTPAIVSESAVNNVERWIKTVVCPVLGLEGFEDCYAHACEEVFTFEGDAEWFQYKYPERPCVHGPVLDCARPTLFRQYTGLSRVTIDPVMAAIHRTDIMGACSRRFILLAVDQFMRTSYGAHWYNAVVVENRAIERSQVKLIKTPCPSLIDILGNGYWVYSKDATVYPCSHIYQSIIVWLQVLQADFSCRLFHLPLHDIVNTVLNSDHAAEGAQKIQKLRKL